MAENKKKYKNSSNERKIQAYPSPKYFKLLSEYSKQNNLSASAIACKAIKQFFDKLQK
jgi:hypothetical protein